ncbi:SRPBCC family protein [Dactylosporangium aurantiacum]|uniref:SRPBCC family protein n=1 Tax=Dactylosporangium aurantiacum TaxID=35754 RepID=A0A9Q9MMB3_9ACTN|nr:SRPBCC family protein [Dactylosporangium aurantiacum]MDG6105884.1 SRPBCC family protein [Dactylosporangium aurantiacum]UWZ57941.1 SRPBCC family protein [Dactylosporangium aurantiacum]
MRVLRTAGLITAAAGLTAAAVYPLLLRHWCLTWGATADEETRPIPGDALLPHPDICSTRAVTIAAPPATVWPWLVQMGSGRAGAYTYDWIENLLGLDMHSADEILPQFQTLRTGDVLPLGERGPRMRAAVVDPARTLTFQSEDGRWVWAFGLYPSAGGTRLVSRNRIATPDATALHRLADLLVMEPGSLIMERRMLLGIKERAETRAPGRRSAAV